MYMCMHACSMHACKQARTHARFACFLATLALLSCLSGTSSEKVPVRPVAILIDLSINQSIDDDVNVK